MGTKTDPAPPPRMYKIDEVAEIMRCSTDYLYELTRNRKVRHTKFGGRILFSQQHLDELMAYSELKPVKR